MKDIMQDFDKQFDKDTASNLFKVQAIFFNQLNNDFNIDDEKQKAQAVRSTLEAITAHLSAFIGALAFEYLKDPENWVKHTFYETLKVINDVKKDKINSLSTRHNENTTEH